MSTHNGKSHFLPSREISYAYTVAMHFGQQLEVNLRAILYAADYHGWGEGLELDEGELKRFKDTGGFIDGATCGLIIRKLRGTGVIPSPSAWKAFERACAHRNKLAHSFLAEEDFDTMTEQRETAIIRRLREMTIDLYQALLISRAIREKVEITADEIHKKMQKYLGEFLGDDWDDPNRRYSTRKRKKKD